MKQACGTANGPGNEKTDPKVGCLPGVADYQRRRSLS